MLLLMAPFGKEDKPETVIAKIRQDILAEIIGTTRSRVSFFLNKFMKLCSWITTGTSTCTAPSPLSSCTTRLSVYWRSPRGGRAMPPAMLILPA